MTLRYLVDGEVVPSEQAVVNVADRGFLYGDAAFETLRIYGGTAFAWEDHMDRLDATCETMALDHGVDRSQLRNWLHRLLDANGLEEAAVRLSITRGVQPGVLAPQPTVDPTVVMIVRPLDRGGLEGESTWSTPASVRVVDVQKIPDAAIPAHAKTHNYLNGILARLELEADDDEAVLLDGDGFVTEGTTSTVFVVDDGVVRTPPLSRGVLPGITRGAVIALAEAIDIPVVEADLVPADLESADEAFLTNTTSEVRPIGRINDTELPVGPLSNRLSHAFRAAIEAHLYG